MLCGKHESVFDSIEHLQTSPFTFCWTPLRDQINSKPITEMKLFQINNENYQEILCTLYPAQLVTCKEGQLFYLNLTNTRIRKTSANSSHYFGVQIVGYKGTITIFTKLKDEQCTFFDFLKRYCIQFHLTNNYNVIKLIGKGHFSRV
jgi:hypothetical protein